MKQKLTYIFLAAASLFTACVNDDAEPALIPQPGGPGSGEVIFSGATVEGSRMSIGDTGTAGTIPIYWTGGDAIGIFTETGGAIAENAKGTLTNGAGERAGKFASFGITMAPSSNIFNIYYPYVQGAGSPGDPTSEEPLRYRTVDGQPSILGLLPSAQEQKSPGTYDQFSRYGYSVAVSHSANEGEEVKFSMKHFLSYLELTLWSSSALPGDHKLKRVELTSTGGASLAGLFRAGFDGNYTPVTGDPGLFHDKVQLSVTNPSAVLAGQGNAQKFLMTLLPAELSSGDIVISVTLGDGKSDESTLTYTKTFNGSDFGPGAIKTLNEDISTWSVRMSTPVSRGLATFVENIGKLEDIAIRFYTETSPVSESDNETLYYGKYPQWAVAMFIRRYAYYSDNWNQTAGAINNSFVSYVQSADPVVFGYFAQNSTAKQLPSFDPGKYDGLGITTRTMDLWHMAATLSTLLYRTPKLTYTIGSYPLTVTVNENVKLYINDAGGWGGDLATFTKYLINRYGVQDEAFYREKTISEMAKPGTTYDMDDLTGDTDAINLANLIRNDGLSLSEAVAQYYTTPGGYQKRFTLFRDSFSSEEDMLGHIDVFSKNKTTYVPSNATFLVSVLLSRDALFGSVTPTAEQGAGVKAGYYEFINILSDKE